MTLFCIRQKSTGFYLPERYSWRSVGRVRGYTHDNPCPAHKRDPRVFQSKRGAINALSAWLRGKWYCSRGQDYEGEYYEDTEIEPQADRDPTDFEVIEYSAGRSGSNYANAEKWKRQDSENYWKRKETEYATF